MFAGPLLRRLGALFLDRFDVADSLADLEARDRRAGSKRLLVFFPEGTFTRRAGLSGFYLGAFKVAAQANLPVVPGILRGTRSMLRGDQWFPRWSPISVSIAPHSTEPAPISPRSCGCATPCARDPGRLRRARSRRVDQTGATRRGYKLEKVPSPGAGMGLR